MWFPEWLYERLPACYAALGAVCLWFGVHSPAAVMSSGLLFGAATLAQVRRRRARSMVHRQARSSTRHRR